jgi:hypothetical protein
MIFLTLPRTFLVHVRTKLSYKNHRIEVRRDVDDTGHVVKSIYVDGAFQCVYTWSAMKPLGCMAFAKTLVDQDRLAKSPDPATVLNFKF